LQQKVFARPLQQQRPEEFTEFSINTIKDLSAHP